MYQILDHTIRLYVPSTVNVDTQIDTTEYVTEALKKFSQLFGGATRYEAKGAWFSQDRNNVVIEDIVIVESKANSASYEAGKAQIMAYAELLKEQLHQEAISVEIDGKMILVGVEE